MHLLPIQRTDGFTLVEMSIVVAIVGLIAGGIVIGESVIRASQVREAVGEFDTYSKALKEFQDKYDALPGDMPNAETIWGTDPGGCPAAANSVFKTATCNGDGNGRIGSSNQSGSQTHTQEWFRAWQQMSNAGLIKGSFTGAPGAGGAGEAVIGNNVPASRVNAAGWTLNYYLLTCLGDLWGDHYGHMLNLGAFKAGDYTKGPVLTPGEALSIDQKIDDGAPGTGKVRPWRASVLPNCVTNDTGPTAATYNTAYSQNACALTFYLGF